MYVNQFSRNQLYQLYMHRTTLYFIIYMTPCLLRLYSKLPLNEEGIIRTILHGSYLEIIVEIYYL